MQKVLSTAVDSYGLVEIRKSPAGCAVVSSPLLLSNNPALHVLPALPQMMI